jgi:hypothetical protein
VGGQALEFVELVLDLAFHGEGTRRGYLDEIEQYGEASTIVQRGDDRVAALAARLACRPLSEDPFDVGCGYRIRV